jgi:hypothetical protein
MVLRGSCTLSRHGDEQRVVVLIRFLNRSPIPVSKVQRIRFAPMSFSVRGPGVCFKCTTSYFSSFDCFDDCGSPEGVISFATPFVASGPVIRFQRFRGLAFQHMNCFSFALREGSIEILKPSCFSGEHVHFVAFESGQCFGISSAMAELKSADHLHGFAPRHFSHVIQFTRSAFRLLLVELTRAYHRILTFAVSKPPKGTFISEFQDDSS